MSTLHPRRQTLAGHETPLHHERERREQQHVPYVVDPTPRRVRRKFVLCFDGTGNKFSGTDADSSILKIYRMLDRSDGTQFHYYQPGIGTYVASGSLSHTSTYGRLRSWYTKIKDSAVGTSFGDHVMGGYKFLMRYYVPGDDIYLFGFSRGAYTARFLAEMLDHIGLLSAGNEEMCRFAWKTFQKWQVRQERNEEEQQEKQRLLDFMCAFRETFSRPIRRIRFLGLFDTVNSVPVFENAWLQRSKFPYTARTTAKIIRHAVAIDERRAKFRQDLISEIRSSPHQLTYHHWHRHRRHKASANNADETERGRRFGESAAQRLSKRRGLAFRDQSETSGIRSLSPNMSPHQKPADDRSSVTSVSYASLPPVKNYEEEEDDDEAEQDILEVWFAGGHGDVGGGWPLEKDEETAVSHIPLVWMVHEAQRAGLNFDEQKLYALNCATPEEGFHEKITPGREMNVPEIALTVSSPTSDHPQTDWPTEAPQIEPSHTQDETTEATGVEDRDVGSHEGDDMSPFYRMLHIASTKSRIHDVLRFNRGLTHIGVISWTLMEYLPFRRMDLQPDGTWRSITWPLPMGEVRDLPDNVVVHNSVIKRLQHDPDYRPGNLICGGGGRGVRRAPPGMGMGRWKVARDEGNPICECYVRDKSPTDTGGKEK